MAPADGSELTTAERFTTAIKRTRDLALSLHELLSSADAPLGAPSGQPQAHLPGYALDVPFHRWTIRFDLQPLAQPDAGSVRLQAHLRANMPMARLRGVLEAPNTGGWVMFFGRVIQTAYDLPSAVAGVRAAVARQPEVGFFLHEHRWDAGY